MVQNFFHQERMGYSCGHWKRVSIFPLINPDANGEFMPVGIGTRLVGSKFSQSSGRLRGLGLAYSPNKGRRFDFFDQWCNDGATQISCIPFWLIKKLRRKWSQENFWCRNVTTWDYLPWISRCNILRQIWYVCIITVYSSYTRRWAEFVNLCNAIFKSRPKPPDARHI